jgi:hypothetical protein
VSRGGTVSTRKSAQSARVERDGWQVRCLQAEAEVDILRAKVAALERAEKVRRTIKDLKFDGKAVEC